MKPFDGTRQPTKFRLTMRNFGLEFWIHLYNLPLAYMNWSNIEQIGSSIGDFIKADIPKGDVRMGSYMRIRVELDVQKSLQTRQFINVNYQKL